MQEEKPGIEVDLPDESATESLGALLAGSLERPMVICLSGDLGAGKTTLTRGFLRAIGHLGAVKSPTFTLVESYAFDSEHASGDKVSGNKDSVNINSRSAGDFRPAGLHHFDLYRIEDPEELDFIGFEEYLDDDYHTIIEWAGRAGDRIDEMDFEVQLVHLAHYRKAYLRGLSSAATAWIEKHKNSINIQ